MAVLTYKSGACAIISSTVIINSALCKSTLTNCLALSKSADREVAYSFDRYICSIKLPDSESIKDTDLFQK